MDARIRGHSDSNGRFQESEYAYYDDATETAALAQHYVILGWFKRPVESDHKDYFR